MIFNIPDIILKDSSLIELSQVIIYAEKPLIESKEGNLTYNVTRDSANGRYVFTEADTGVVDNSIILARGGTYNFVVDQPGFPFWIQTEVGTDGVFNALPLYYAHLVFTNY